MMTSEQRVLDFNPWGYDDTEYRVLRNSLLMTRSQHGCAICFDTIPSRARVRAQTEVFDGTVKTFYFCPLCCDAMIADEDGLAIEERYAQGRAAAESQRETK
jgi:hypothetical protein